MRLTIKNSTAWSDAALQVITRWVLRRAGIKDWYKMRVTNSRSWRGVCVGAHRCTIRLSRRYKPDKWPIVHKYRDRKSFPEVVINTRLELLVHLLAHEIYHSVQAREPGGWRAPEWDAENWAKHAMAAFREDWQCIRGMIMMDMRADRQRQGRKDSLKLVKRAERLRDLLEDWERKAKMANTKIKKYRKALARVEKRAAMKTGV